jgi:hypothetical protein
MPIFARRRLQFMLDALGEQLGPAKRLDLRNRLEDKRVEQALPAEMELALLWAISELGELEVEPEWWGDRRRPDIYTEALLPGREVVIEIAAPNDNEISGEEAMDRIARQISAVADAVVRGIGDHLYYRFDVRSGYERSGYYRRRLAPADHILEPAMEAKIREWILCGASERERLALVGQGLSVEVERTAEKQWRYHNIFSSMPPETHSLEANPLFRLLERKERQLRAAQPGVVRLVFLADVGSTLLNRLGRGGEIDPTHRRVSGREIISHFLAGPNRRVDGVVVFSPRREPGWGALSTVTWAISVLAQRDLGGHLQAGLERVADLMPAPRFEGYQARQLFRQGAYSPHGRGWYLGVSMGGRVKEEIRVSLPARALLDFLAGRITEAQFRRFIGQGEGDKNLFSTWLSQGLTFSAAEMAARSIDQDDDHLVLTFSDDPAARSLK